MRRNPLAAQAKTVLIEYGYNKDVEVDGWHVTCFNANGAWVEIHAKRHWRIQVSEVHSQHAQNQRKLSK